MSTATAAGSELDILRTDLRDKARELDKAEAECLRLRRLIREMDANRESLGDACRCCGERVWAGPNGSRKPHHAEKCPVWEASA